MLVGGEVVGGISATTATQKTNELVNIEGVSFLHYYTIRACLLNYVLGRREYNGYNGSDFCIVIIYSNNKQ